MHTISETTTQFEVTTEKPRFVFVLQLVDGTIAVGSATNPCRRIAAINSGLNPAVKKSLQVYKIVGIKDMTSDRNEVTVYKKFAAKYGESKVIAV